jgi:3'(2'),5'-bisphosphate nucleotidase
VSEGTKIDGEFFLVDPLDGTKEFLKRNDEFTVNIALIVEGIPVMGVVFAPALGEMFYAAQGEGAWKQDAQGLHAISTSLHDGVRPLRVMGSRSHGADKLNAWLDNLTQVHTFTAAGSSLKFCRIAEGLADIYPRFGPTSQWDTAAAQALLEEAGGKVVDMQGDRLHYGLDRPILNPEFMAVGALNVSEFIG